MMPQFFSKKPWFEYICRHGSVEEGATLVKTWANSIYGPDSRWLIKGRYSLGDCFTTLVTRFNRLYVHNFKKYWIGRCARGLFNIIWRKLVKTNQSSSQILQQYIDKTMTLNVIKPVTSNVITWLKMFEASILLFCM